ncbi:hypothetical protein TorRG33x02_060520 [Trema orientale]|uniref:Uncharacterized protein n=1 Tax=Trema orientale TaxID=63057 RepID=A0A2P5FK96_TREOI|nr:hypothetical protein TorRG33x02_060520 [Trema orientale]
MSTSVATYHGEYGEPTLPSNLLKLVEEKGPLEKHRAYMFWTTLGAQPPSSSQQFDQEHEDEHLGDD